MGSVGLLDSGGGEGDGELRESRDIVEPAIVATDELEVFGDNTKRDVRENSTRQIDRHLILSIHAHIFFGN